MEIDNNYIQYLVDKQVKRSLEEFMSRVTNKQVEIIERVQKIERLVDLDSIDAQWGRDEDGKPLTEEDWVAEIQRAIGN